MKMLKNIGPQGVKFTSEYLVGIKFSEQNGSRKSLYEDQVLKKKTVSLFLESILLTQTLQTMA